VTCWHKAQTYRGGNPDRDCDPMLREPFMAHVRHRWGEDRRASTAAAATPGLLGLYLARSLTDTYDASNRMLERWVEGWEVAFYEALSGRDKARHLAEAAGEISNLLAMTGEFRRRVTALHHARTTTDDKTWFPNLGNGIDKHPHVEALAETLNSAAAQLRRLGDHIGKDMDLLMLQSAATQHEADERLQGFLANITGLVLVPTLVVGLFGANTRLPGGGSWLGFELMLILMLVSAVIVYFVIRKIARSRHHARRSPS
jgi:Mg2+ and Co2+ transporter CorA